ncbi:MAG: hypothetical protein WDA07_06530 [Leucobacter sp.]
MTREPEEAVERLLARIEQLERTVAVLTRRAEDLERRLSSPPPQPQWVRWQWVR